MTAPSTRESEALDAGILTIELFYAPGCPHCAHTRALLQEWVRTHSDRVRLEQVNVLEALERAVDLRIRRTPTVVIDNEPVFTGPPTEAAFLTELQRRLG